jgi:hypothetical protein
MRNVSITNVDVDVSCKALFHFGTAPSASYDLQPFMLCKYVDCSNIKNIGGNTEVITADMPWNGSWFTSFSATKTVDFQFNQEAVLLNSISSRGATTLVNTALKTTAPAQTTTFDATNLLEWTNLATGSYRRGPFSGYAALLGSPTDPGGRTILDRIEFTNKLQFSSSDRGVFFGAGSPEGVLTANQGSVYFNTSGGAGVTLYVKESGYGNTGWVGK